MPTARGPTPQPRERCARIGARPCVASLAPQYVRCVASVDDGELGGSVAFIRPDDLKELAFQATAGNGGAPAGFKGAAALSDDCWGVALVSAVRDAWGVGAGVAGGEPLRAVRWRSFGEFNPHVNPKEAWEKLVDEARVTPGWSWKKSVLI